MCGYQFSFLKLYFQRAFYYVAAVDGIFVDLACSVVAHTWKNEETIKQIILYVCSQLLHFFGQQNNNNNNGNGSSVVIKIYHPKNQNFEPFPKGILHRYIVTSWNFFWHVWRNREETKYSAISHFTYHLWVFSHSPFMLVTAHFLLIKTGIHIALHTHIHIYHFTGIWWWKCTCNNFIKPHTHGRIVRIERDTHSV